MKFQAVRQFVFLTLAFFALVSMSGTAYAEDKLLTNPAEKFFIAPGGVDMRTGQFVYQNTDLSIGPEDGGLALIRTAPNYTGDHLNPFKNFSHNFDIMLMETRVHIASGSSVGTDYRMLVQLGGRTLTFESLIVHSGYAYKGDGPFALLTYAGGTRESATAVYTLRTPDGTLITFRPIGSYDCANRNWGSSPMRCAYISEMVQPDGTKLAFEYDYDGGLANHRARLRKVVSSRGYALLLEGTGSQVTKACAFNLSQAAVPASNLCPASGQPTVHYAYDPLARPWLTGFTDVGGSVWAWTYNQSAGNTSMGYVKPGASTPWLTNTIFKRLDEGDAMQDIVGAQSFADGRTYFYGYNQAPYTNGRPNPAIAGGRYVNAQGQYVDIIFDYRVMPGTEPQFCPQPPCQVDEPDSFNNATYQQTPGPVSITDELGRITTFDYCDPIAMANLPWYYSERCYVEALQSFVDPEGAKTELKYDGSRNVTEVRRKSKPGSGLSDIVTAATYNCAVAVNCTKPVTMTDAKGGVTSYSYDTVHGGLLTEMQPAPVAGGARPLKLRTYVQKYAYILNGGSLIAAGTPVWVPATETVCQTVAGSSTPICDGGALQTVTTYEYGADGTAHNLLLRGVAVTADGQTLRTCYSYDVNGRRISETKPAANLGVCP
jgi:YD repeat-containing protein